MTEHILFEQRGHVALVTLNRPDKLNALTIEMIDELGALAARIDADTSIRCAVVTGAGTRAFCAGADVAAWTKLSALDMWRVLIRRGHQVFDRWAQLRVPLIGALNGSALGGGLEFAATADLRVAVPGANFALPETSIAAVPAWSGTQRLSNLIGPSRVKSLALAGKRMSAAEALQAGFLHEIADDALSASLALAENICARAPIAVQLVKQLVDASQGQGTARTLEGMAAAVTAATLDAKEGAASFLQRRPANYQGE